MLFPLVVAVDAGTRTGEWDAADAEAEEAIRLAVETRHPPALMLALTFRARLAAARGREPECRDSSARAIALAQPVGAQAVIVFAQAALGFLSTRGARRRGSARRCC